MASAGRDAKIMTVPNNIMRARLDVDVEVGFGVTDPASRIHRLVYGLDATAKVAPDFLQRLKPSAVGSEIFGILGYQGGGRFFMDDDEFAEHQEKNQPPPSETQLKIESAERIAAAQLELDRLVEEAKIMSKERQVAAALSVEVGDTVNTQEVAALGQNIDISKVQIEAKKVQVADKKVEYDHQDSMRKDAEIKDVDTAKQR